MNPLDPHVRIADSDRERAMADLATHYTDGRLDHEEYDERLDAVWTARTRADLAVLFADLPRPVATRPPVAPVAQRSARRPRMPLFPVFALLIVLSILTEAPLWLLVFPLMFFRARHGARRPAYDPGHGRAHGVPHGHTDYRRPGRSPGW